MTLRNPKWLFQVFGLNLSLCLTAVAQTEQTPDYDQAQLDKILEVLKQGGDVGTDGDRQPNVKALPADQSNRHESAQTGSTGKDTSEAGDTKGQAGLDVDIRVQKPTLTLPDWPSFPDTMPPARPGSSQTNSDSRGQSDSQSNTDGRQGETTGQRTGQGRPDDNRRGSPEGTAPQGQEAASSGQTSDGADPFPIFTQPEQGDAQSGQQAGTDQSAGQGSPSADMQGNILTGILADLDETLLEGAQNKVSKSRDVATNSTTGYYEPSQTDATTGEYQKEGSEQKSSEGSEQKSSSRQQAKTGEKESQESGSKGKSPGAKGHREAPGRQTPPDIPPGDNDDIIARQMREAAMTETDPELKEKLWEEYRRYKGL